MEIEFAPDKDASNQQKHCVSIALAAGLQWDTALAWEDTQYECGEWRMIALAPEINILYYVAFADRGEISSISSIISLRPATRREVKYYVENL
jgi:uncharacterized protein